MPSNGDAERYGHCYFQLDKRHGIMHKPTYRAAEAIFTWLRRSKRKVIA
jgi:hypothetical protein